MLVAAARVALLAISLGCASSRRAPQSPLDTPPLVSRLSQRCGAPLGPVAPSGSVDALAARVEHGWIARVRLWATEFAPSALDGVVQAPLGSRARLISAELGGAAVEPRAVLAEGAWRVEATTRELHDAPEFGRTRALDDFESALPSGATLRLEWRSSIAGARQALRVELARESADAGGADLALVFEGELERESEAADSDAASRTLRREALALEERVALGPDAAMRFVLPSPFPGGEARGLLLEITLGARDDETALAAAIERCRASELGAVEATRALVERELHDAQLTHWVRALRDAPKARGALLELASHGGADLSVDLALCASAADLQGLASATAKALEAAGALTAPASELGWRIECANLNWLAAQKDSRALPYELEGVLVRRTGELGRSAAALADAASTCASLEQFARRVREENWTFLDDHSAATRVRALDWLAARGWAPAGYDPLAQPAERRAALDAREGGP